MGIWFISELIQHRITIRLLPQIGVKCESGDKIAKSGGMGPPWLSYLRSPLARYWPQDWPVRNAETDGKSLFDAEFGKPFAYHSCQIAVI